MYSAEEHVCIPKRQTKCSAGYDFYMPYDLDLEPGQDYLFSTKINLDGGELPYFTAEMVEADNINRKIVKVYPNQWSIKLYPRSSLGNKYGMKLANTVGLIDQDYIDNAITVKLSVTQPLSLKKGDRFMQGEVTPVCYFEGESIPDAVRNGGNGSTDTTVDPDELNKKINSLLALLPNIIGACAVDTNKDYQTGDIQKIVDNVTDTMKKSGMMEFITESVTKELKKTD